MICPNTLNLSLQNNSMRVGRTLVFILFCHLKNLGKMKIHIWWFSYKGVSISLTWVIPWSFMSERKKQVTYISLEFNAWEILSGVPHRSVLPSCRPCPCGHKFSIWYIIFQQKSDSKYTSLLPHPLYKYQESHKIKYLLTTSIQDENGKESIF